MVREVRVKVCCGEGSKSEDVLWLTPTCLPIDQDNVGSVADIRSMD